MTYPAIYGKCAGAYGRFRPYMSFSDLTDAGFLADPERETGVFVRFSRMTGLPGSSDTLRDIRGFSTRFFTEAGIYDLICQNCPWFPVRDCRDFPAFIRSLLPDPLTGICEKKAFWEFITDRRHPLEPQALLWLYSDFGTIKSYRHIGGYSIVPYIWKTGVKESRLRFRWTPMGGTACIRASEAEFLAGFDPDASLRDLTDAIRFEQFPEYELSAQFFDDQDRPLQEVPIGALMLDRLPGDFSREVCGVHFSPANLVTGIQLSEDPLLQAMRWAHRPASPEELYAAEEAARLMPAAKLQLRAPGILLSGGINPCRCVHIDPTAAEPHSIRYPGIADNLSDAIMFFDDRLLNAALEVIAESSPELCEQIKSRIL